MMTYYRCHSGRKTVESGMFKKIFQIQTKWVQLRGGGRGEMYMVFLPMEGPECACAVSCSRETHNLVALSLPVHYPIHVDCDIVESQVWDP